MTPWQRGNLYGRWLHAALRLDFKPLRLETACVTGQ